MRKTEQADAKFPGMRLASQLHGNLEWCWKRASNILYPQPPCSTEVTGRQSPESSLSTRFPQAAPALLQDTQLRSLDIQFSPGHWNGRLCLSYHSSVFEDSNHSGTGF